MSVVLLETFAIEASSTPGLPPAPLGVSALWMPSTNAGSVAETSNVSGSGLDPSALYAEGSALDCWRNACCLEMNSTRLTCATPRISLRTRASSDLVAFVFM